MFDYIDSKAMDFFQKLNNFMEEWLDWWDRFQIARLFGVLSGLSYSTAIFLWTLSKRDREWGGPIFMVALVFAILWWGLRKYIRHRETVSSDEESSGLIKIYEIDLYAESNRRWTPFWSMIILVLWQLIDSPIERRPEYLWAATGGDIFMHAAYFCVYVSLCLAGVSNGKRKHRLKELAKRLVDKMVSVVSPGTPELAPQSIVG